MRIFELRRVRGFPQFSFSSRFRCPRLWGFSFTPWSSLLVYFGCSSLVGSVLGLGLVACASAVAAAGVLEFLLHFDGHPFWSSPAAVLRLVPVRIWSYFHCLEQVGRRVLARAGQELLFSDPDAGFDSPSSNGEGVGSSGCCFFFPYCRLRPGLGLVVGWFGFPFLWGLPYSSLFGCWTVLRFIIVVS